MVRAPDEHHAAREGERGLVLRARDVDRPEPALEGGRGGDWEIQGNVGRGLRTRSGFKRLDLFRSAMWLWYVVPAIVVPRNDQRFGIVDAAQQFGRLIQAASR